MDLSELGKTPISDESPAGTDVRYEPEFEQLQAEIDKLSSPTAQGRTDWKKVIAMASEILQGKSKDLLVASYLAAGLMLTQKLEGLSIGLKVFGDMLETFWDNLFPPKKRMRGRRAAIEWLVERADTYLAQMEGVGIEPEKADELLENLNRIDAFLGENLDDPPSFATLTRFIETNKKSPQEPPKAPEPEGPSPSAAAPMPAAEPAAPEVIASVDEARKVLRSAMQRIRQAAGFMGDMNVTDPLPYRLRRLAVWSLIETFPPATDGKTRIPPPPAQVKGILGKLYEEQNWESLLTAAESRIGEFVYWLDLHFFAGHSLACLGAQYEKAHEALCQETAYFVYRLPGIETMQFSDGTAFASDETRRWLQEISLGTGAIISNEGEASEAAKEQMVTDLTAEEIEKAKALVKKRKLVDAISLLQRHMRLAYSGRERLLWQLGICQVLLDGKKGFLVIPHLDQILRNMEAYRLEEWEPELALKALKMAWIVFNSSADAQHKKRAEEVIARIARLDATEAVKLKKKA